MPTKQFLKGKHQLTLYPTTKQLEQLKKKMTENGYKTLTKYLIDMGLNAIVKTTIEVDSTHKNNTAPFPVMPHNKEAAEALFNGDHPHKNNTEIQLYPDKPHDVVVDKPAKKQEIPKKLREAKPAMVQTFGKGGK